MKSREDAAIKGFQRSEEMYEQGTGWYGCGTDPQPQSWFHEEERFIGGRVSRGSNDEWKSLEQCAVQRSLVCVDLVWGPKSAATQLPEY